MTPPRRRHWWPVGVWLAVVAAMAAVAFRSSYVADLSAFLPSAPTPEQAALLDPLKEGAAARLVLVGIEGGEATQRAEASRRLAAALRASGAFASVDNGDTAAYRDAGRFVFDHRYLLSPAVDANRFTVDGLRSAIDDTLSLLGTPAGSLVKPILLRDPTGESVRIAEALTPSHSPRLENGVWVSRSAPRALLVMTTKADGGDLDGQATALQTIDTSFAAAASATPLRLVVSGAPVFAVASRAHIKSEAERLAAFGTVAVVGLLAVAFASLRALVVGLLPVLTGVLAGVTATSVGFGSVHGMTLGFGTTLIGEAVDYAIYDLIQASPPRSAARAAPGQPSGAARWIWHSWPTVRLGVVTSLIGFAALLFAGFSGLAQLGAFSIAGLVAAAATTRFVFPVVAPDGAPGTRLRDALGRFMQRSAQRLPAARWPLAALVVAGALALAFSPSPWRGQLTDLSPIAPEALARDAELRADLGAPDTGTLVVVSGSSEAGALAAAERAGTRLDALMRKGALEGYTSPARFLPSPQVQAARRAAIPDAQTLRDRLVAATDGGPLPADRLEAFIADAVAARAAPPIGRASIDGTPLAAAVDALLLPAKDGKPWRAFINLQPAPDRALDLPRLRAALADVSDARLVAIKPELDALYARYVERAIWQAAIGALAVVALLAWNLRSARRLARVLLPLAASVLVVLGALAASGAALGILHIVGLLLTVAIGSNYALFFDQLRQAPAGVHGDSTGGASELDTLASLLLANLTIVVSFAMLATSSIPVLRAIGIVVAPGTLLCLVFSAAFIARRDGWAATPLHGKMHAS